MPTYKVLGLMSGTSMDGLDVCYCHITETKGKWTYSIKQAECLPYDAEWQRLLKQMVMQNAVNYLKGDVQYGHYVGELVKAFIERHNIYNDIDFIAHHGQTIFHQPEHKLTSQIGDNGAIAGITRLPVIGNFRSVDIAMGGQGGPLVPIGDILFFNEYKLCLNIGGIANISCKVPDGKIIAYDVVPANLVMNELAQKMKVPFDNNGEIARSGTLNEELLNALNDCWYYKKEYPKTIGGGFVSKVVIPTLYRFRLPWADKLRTVVEHIALQISKDLMVINNKSNAALSANDKMLATGGGAYNTFLIERIKQFSPVQIVVPDEHTVKFKEALIMGLLGVLRIRNEANVLSAVTGATEDNIGGEVFTFAGKPIKG